MTPEGTEASRKRVVCCSQEETCDQKLKLSLWTRHMLFTFGLTADGALHPHFVLQVISSAWWVFCVVSFAGSQVWEVASAEGGHGLMETCRPEQLGILG